MSLDSSLSTTVEAKPFRPQQSDIMCYFGSDDLVLARQNYAAQNPFSRRDGVVDSVEEHFLR